MGIERFKIAASLAGVVAQRLVRNLCQDCREVYYPPAKLLDEFRYTGNARHPFSRSRGCSQCYESGYRGRTGIYELFESTTQFRDLINSDASLDELRTSHRGPTLFSEGMRLAETGMTSLEEVGRVAMSD